MTINFLDRVKRSAKMKQNKRWTYSAFVYELENRFMADCVLLNLITSGVTPQEAVENLKQEIKNTFKRSDIAISPVYERR
jgi:hypothetical protein